MGKGRIPEHEVRIKLLEIAKRISLGFTDHDIMKQLEMPERTYHHYKQRIYESYGNIARRKMEDTLEFEASILKDRYVRLYRNLELRLTNKDAELYDVAHASEIAAMIATNILRLEAEGIKSRQAKQLASIEPKAIRYIRDIQSDIQESDIPTDDTNTDIERSSQRVF